MNKPILRSMKESDLTTVLNWRNHSDVRKYMYSTKQIKINEHLDWYAKESQNPAVHLLIYEKDEQPMGFVNISHKRFPKIAEWGFYLDPNGGVRGSGMELGNLAIDFTFKNLKMHKLCGQAIAFNSRSITFHEKLGFLKEGVGRDHFFDGFQFHDVMYFGLLRREAQLLIKD